MDKNPTRCIKCLLPIGTSGIYFNQDGICNLCASALSELRLPSGHVSQDSINQVVNNLRQLGKGRKYDCLVGLSGGIDSSYLLHLLVKKHKLRCLAAYYRTPFTPETIDDNVKRMVNILEVPLVEIQLSRDYHKAVARDFVIAWKKSKDPILANLACAPCKFLHRELFIIANNYDIPSVVHGDNKYEHTVVAAGQFLSDNIDRYSLGANLLRIFLIIKRGLRLLFKYPIVFRNIGLVFKASILYLNPYTAYLRIRYPNILVVNYFNYADWDETECNNALKEIGWILPHGCNSSKKADCIFAELKNMMFRESIGANYIDFLFSNLIRYGIISREEALKRIEKEGKVSLDRLKETYYLLNLSDDFF